MDSVNPLEEACKFILCVLRTQFGKTFAAINRISTEIEQDVELGRSIHIVFTMNTLLNNHQFAKRLETIERTYGKGSICVFTSKYDGKYAHVKNRLELQGLCADEMTCPRVVVMCSNKRRYDDGVEFIKVLDKNDINVSRVFAYFDELHEYINEGLRSQIEDIHALNIVQCIIALTATPDTIWDTSGFWSRLQLIYLDDFNDTNYAGWGDMIFNRVDDFFAIPYVRPNPFDFDELDKHTIGFITHVLERCPDIIHDNARIFIPAHIRRSGHNQVRDLVFRINPQTVVVMINGTEKTIQYKDPLERIKTVPLSGEEEVCEIISKLIVKHNIQTRPVVITGFLCVGMGQTLTHPSMGSFTSAIFGHMDLSNDDLSQLFGRITGRTKDWEKYIQTQVYCPTIIEYRCHVMEECARRMLQDHNGGIVTQENYRVPMTVMGEEGRVALDNIRARKETKNPKKKEKGSVPTVIQISEEQFGRIRPGGKGSTWNFDALFACMTHEFKERLVQINRRPIDHECPDPTKPGYKKKITNYVNASKSSKKISTWVGKDKRGGLKTYYVIYLDQVEFRIIVSITQSDELADRSK